MRTTATNIRILSSRYWKSSHLRTFRTSTRNLQVEESTNIHRNFYKSHGRALFKALTLAFFSYQFFYWSWLTLETEYMKDEKDREIKSLQSEVRLLNEGRNSHRPGGLLHQEETDTEGQKLLEESALKR